MNPSENEESSSEEATMPPSLPSLQQVEERSEPPSGWIAFDKVVSSEDWEAGYSEKVGKFQVSDITYRKNATTPSALHKRL